MRVRERFGVIWVDNIAHFAGCDKRGCQLTLEPDMCRHKMILRHGDNPECAYAITMRQLVSEPHISEDNWVYWVEQLHKREDGRQMLNQPGGIGG